MSLNLLTQMVPPPSTPMEPGSPEEWMDVERRLGTPLPEDYKAYIALYGTGTFDDFIVPFSPFAANRHLNLFQVLAQLGEATRVHELNFPQAPPSIVHPFELYPAKDGLLVWGTTTNFGDQFFWQVSGDPVDWSLVLYNLQDGEYEVFHETLTGFLAGVFARTIRPSLFPHDYPGDTKSVFQAVHSEEEN